MVAVRVTHSQQRFFILEESSEKTNILVQPLQDPHSYELFLFARRVLQTSFGDQQDKDAVTSIDGFEDRLWTMERDSERNEVCKGVQRSTGGDGSSYIILEHFYERVVL